MLEHKMKTGTSSRYWRSVVRGYWRSLIERSELRLPLSTAASCHRLKGAFVLAPDPM